MEEETTVNFMKAIRLAKSIGIQVLYDDSIDSGQWRGGNNTRNL